MPPKSPRSALAAIGFDVPGKRRSPGPTPIEDARSSTASPWNVVGPTSSTLVAVGRRDHDRSRSRDADVTLGADDFDFSRELAQVIDDDRVKAYQKVLQDEFALERNKLRSEAIEHVSR